MKLENLWQGEFIHPHNHHETEKNKKQKKEDTITAKEAIEKIESEENQNQVKQEDRRQAQRRSPHPQPGGCLEVTGVDAYLQGLGPEARRKPVSPASSRNLEFW